MAQPIYNPGEAKTFGNGYLFGAPVKDLGWLACFIMSIAAGFIAFFAATFVGIVFFLFHHGDFTVSYRLMGLPCGVLVTALSMAYLGTFWVKRIFRRA